ncbi:Radical SAM domain protein [Candidatus Desulforudis audaxviator MP104C]|uniref:Radical SAM domain protein n=1 Tax=Desulforudis audaxviator (strain MP104C) TaxID=477974 RepID=B1I633_DESAP|nr:Radical SAM domain protein [Candidatus Desulforudis audaxviator MP104C]AZK60554.1 Radical SAM domain protein [Candidatus Desulforudis audaxviator]
MPEAVVKPAYCKTALNRTGIGGYRYCLNPYFGCAHGCLYCYADTILRFASRAGKWGGFVAPKVNFPEVFGRELRRKRAFSGRIILGTVTDVYQPAEAEFGLTRDSLKVLAEEYPNAEVEILTKSDLVVRDADLLRKLQHCSVGFTVTVPDDGAASALEPGAAPSSARLQAAGKLAAAGIDVWAFIAPVLPGITDAPGVLERLVGAMRDAGVKEVCLDALNPYPASVERLMVAYRAGFPRAVKCLERYLSDPSGYLQALSGELVALSRRHGFYVRPPRPLRKKERREREKGKVKG